VALQEQRPRRCHQRTGLGCWLPNGWLATGKIHLHHYCPHSPAPLLSAFISPNFVRIHQPHTVRIHQPHYCPHSSATSASGARTSSIPAAGIMALGRIESETRSRGGSRGQLTKQPSSGRGKARPQPPARPPNRDTSSKRKPTAPPRAHPTADGFAGTSRLRSSHATLLFRSFQNNDRPFGSVVRPCPPCRLTASHSVWISPAPIHISADERARNNGFEAAARRILHCLCLCRLALYCGPKIAFSKSRTDAFQVPDKRISNPGQTHRTARTQKNNPTTHLSQDGYSPGSTSPPRAKLHPNCRHGELWLWNTQGHWRRGGIRFELITSHIYLF